MTESHEPGKPATPAEATYTPPHTAGPTTIITQVQPQRSLIGSFFRWIFTIAFPVLSALTFGIFLGVFVALGMGDAGLPLNERTYSGNDHAKDKVAIVKIEGVIMEGATQFAVKQIDKAAADEQVKAVIVRVNSPGGTITASDDLYHRLLELRDGTNPKNKNRLKKELVVSMGSVAASGGYYIAMPAAHLVAEPTTITGSIGVYAAFLNLTGLAEKYGFGMEVIKAGDLKDSGSMFHRMAPQERQLWQEMVDHVYERFLTVVEEGRPELGNYWFSRKLKEELKDETRSLPADPTNPDPKQQVTFVRRRADGGIFTADKALKYGLIDQIGYLEDAISAVKKRASLGDDVRVVSYDRPNTLVGALFNRQTTPGTNQLDLSSLAGQAAPRLWYLAPHHDLARFLTPTSP